MFRKISTRWQLVDGIEEKKWCKSVVPPIQFKCNCSAIQLYLVGRDWISLILRAISWLVSLVFSRLLV